MANYSTNEFKGGLKIMQDGEPCSIVENEMVKPGKGQAFNRVKIRKLISGKVVEKSLGAQVHLCVQKMDAEMRRLRKEREREKTNAGNFQSKHLPRRRGEYYDRQLALFKGSNIHCSPTSHDDRSRTHPVG